jgi:hypothetical protein
MDPATMAMLSQLMQGQGGGQGQQSGMFGGGGGGQGLIGGGHLAGIGQILSGLFGDSGAPYRDAMKQYEKWGQKGQDVQNPFLNMGKGAIPQYQEWLQSQKDPSGFINNLMNGYQESPWAKYQQDQSARRFGNAGSASGMTGSTPLAQFEQQGMHDISSQDMNQWLSHVLGINTQYGQGLGNEISGGQNAANSLTNLFGNMGNNMAEAAYGKRAGQQQDRNSIWGGLFG